MPCTIVSWIEKRVFRSAPNRLIRRDLLRSTATLTLAGCLSLSGCDFPRKDSASKQIDQSAERVSGDRVNALAESGHVTGPNGETPTPSTEIHLTELEVAKIRQMHATAAIVLHYGGNDWSNAQVAGLKAQFEKLGIAVIAITDAGFKPEKQVADLETVLAKKPDIIVSIPTDPVATAGTYEKVASRGVKLVLMDNIPKGLAPGRDYVSVVSADNYGNGVVAAQLMGAALGGKGEIGLIYHASDFFVTRERYNGFKRTIREQFPQIRITAEQGIGGPDFSGDGEKAASAMLTSHRNLAGIWAVWDVPAEGVIAAGRTAGRHELVITTCDLGQIVAIDMARGGFVKGIGAQRAFDQGATEALLAGYGLIGKTAPSYVVVPALSVTKENLFDAWDTVYHIKAPFEVMLERPGATLLFPFKLSMALALRNGNRPMLTLSKSSHVHRNARNANVTY